MSNIGERILNLRNKKGWTKEELASKLNVDEETVSKWESGDKIPSLETITSLANIFNVSLDFLIAGKNPEKEIIVMSKYELSAKNDDPTILNNLSFSIINTKDDDGNTLLDYIKKYESLNLFKALINSDNPRTVFNSLFPNNVIDLSIVLLLFKIDKESIIKMNPYGISFNNVMNNFSSNLIKLGNYMGNKDLDYKSDVSEEFSKIFKFLVCNYERLDYSQKKVYFDLDNEDIFNKGNIWFNGYPYLIDFAYRYNKELFIKIINRIEVSNNLYRERFDELKKTCVGYESNYKIDDFKNKYYFAQVLPKTVLSAIDKEDYDTAHILNKYCLEPIPEDTFDQMRITKNNNIDEKEKSFLHCVHYGVISIDELINLNDFDLYKKGLERFPISKYEIPLRLIEEKKYKELYNFVFPLKDFLEVIDDLKERKEDMLKEDYIGDLKFAKLDNEINLKYLKKFIGYNSCLTPETFEGAKNYISLEDVLDKDLRFVEKACKNATQRELDQALLKAQPNNFKLIKILLDSGAKIHNIKFEEDGDGYTNEIDTIDEIGTEVLKKKINDVLGLEEKQHD